MKTVGIDTNTLLTFRLKRKFGFEETQKLFEKCVDGKIKVYTPVPVLLEIEWVLRSFYKQTKVDIVKFLDELMIIPNLTTNRKEEFKFALNLYRESRQISFTDCLIVTQI